MVYTTGHGVNGFTLDPSLGEFLLSHENIRIPKRGKIYSINEGNINQWDAGTRRYIEYVKEDQKAEAVRIPCATSDRWSRTSIEIC